VLAEERERAAAVGKVQEQVEPQAAEQAAVALAAEVGMEREQVLADTEEPADTAAVALADIHPA
jgi:hypothetical protein